MGRVLNCGCCGSGQKCCCTPKVIHEWSGCEDLSEYFDQETNSLADLMGTCVPCGSGKNICNNTIGWRIIALGREPDCTGSYCNDWDYAIKVVETGDVINDSGYCFFERCNPDCSGYNYFCPTGVCPEVQSTGTYQLQFGCDNVWPDAESYTPIHNWFSECSGCENESSECPESGCQDCADCDEFTTKAIDIDDSLLDAGCQCFPNTMYLNHGSNCVFTETVFQAGISPCFGDINSMITCSDGEWLLTIAATSMCDGMCDETWTTTIPDQSGCPSNGSYELVPNGSSCGGNLLIDLYCTIPPI